MTRGAGAGLVAWLLLSGALPVAAASAFLTFDAPDRLEPLVPRLRVAEPAAVEAALRSTGLPDPGPPVRVVLAEPGAPALRLVPPWVAGFAAPEAAVIVLVPDRVASYPYGSLETVLTHELTHVFTARAAGGRPVPRWFDEGLAMVASRGWRFDDQARLIWAMVSDEPIPLDQLPALFHDGAAPAHRAYVLSHAFVRHLLRQAGPDAPRRILDQVAHGASFEEAFARAAGVPLARTEAAFWEHQTLWNRWVPVITSSTALWMGITLLALYASRRQRRRVAAIRQQWRDEGDDEDA